MTTYGTFAIDSVPAPSDFELETAGRGNDMTEPMTAEEKADALYDELEALQNRFDTEAALYRGPERAHFIGQILAHKRRVRAELRRLGAPTSRPGNERAGAWAKTTREATE